MGEIEHRRHRLAHGNSVQSTRLKRDLQLMEAIPEAAEYSGSKPGKARRLGGYTPGGARADRSEAG